MEENYDLSENQIETISYNIYKDIEQYIDRNQGKYFKWSFRRNVQEYITYLDGIENIKCMLCRKII